ncbi:MAG: phosphoglycerate kinase [Alphaproteobacteria bacterium]|nr:phosphoglycerate kinase [Alphaproteobacteria bacterium]
MSSEFLTLDDVDVSNKIILLRGDLNVPMQDGLVSDLTRLQRLVKTIDELKSKHAKIVVLSHFGRPKGKIEPTLSLAQIVPALAKVLNAPVAFCAESTGEKAKAAIAAMKSGDVLVLENTRFHKGEEENDPALIKAFAALGDVFVNDAFSVTHRAHASTEGLAHILPSCCGRDMQNELEALARALETPVRPVVAIVGGSKVSTKLSLLNNLTAKVDVLVLGGGMANTFLAAQGLAVGKSLYEPDMLDTARKIMAESKSKGCTILLPSDVVVAGAFAANAHAQIVDATAIPADQMALDVGPKTVVAIEAALAKAKTVVWNGPLGAFEIPPFEKATIAVANRVAQLTSSGKVLSVAGGGDTVAAVNMAKVGDTLSYVSTAGGAFLEWLEGCALPGVEILRKKENAQCVAFAL